MTADRCSVTVIHSDSESGRFVVLLSDDGQLVHSHWQVFQRVGFPSVQPGARFSVTLGCDPKDGLSPVVEAVHTAEAVVEAAETGLPPVDTDAASLNARLAETDGVVIFRGLRLGDYELRDLCRSASVVFVDCHFAGDFRWLDARIDGGLWFLNCRFERHFSLRGTRLTGNATVFACDFGGPGGVSFRGLTARSLFIEYGTRGAEDMLWLNEMRVTGCVSLNGIFPAPVQILARQDVQPVNDCPGIGRLLIGRRAYRHERLSPGAFNGGITIAGYGIENTLEVFHCAIGELSLQGLRLQSLVIDDCEFGRDLRLEQIQPGLTGQGLTVRNCTVGRHLRVIGRSLAGPMDLSGTSVGQTWVLELSHPEEGVPQVDLHRFHAADAWFEPIHLVYGARKATGRLAPPPFRLLRTAGADLDPDEQRRRQAQAYTTFKNWLASAGHLREEDHAFFHMRHAKERRLLPRLFLGGVFGWGIRLRNVVLSAAAVVLGFALVYVLMGKGSWLEAGLLSAQAFISSFFGNWPDYAATGALSVLVTLESAIGVLFITVLIGAYIRKLLR